ncbi:hypothetical protein [Azospirillum largimobile]
MGAGVGNSWVRFRVLRSAAQFTASVQPPAPGRPITISPRALIEPAGGRGRGVHRQANKLLCARVTLLGMRGFDRGVERGA